MIKWRTELSWQLHLDICRGHVWRPLGLDEGMGGKKQVRKGFWLKVTFKLTFEGWGGTARGDKVEKAREQHVEKQRQVRKQVKSRDCVRAQEEGGKCVVKVRTWRTVCCIWAIHTLSRVWWEAAEDSRAKEWQDQFIRWLCGNGTGEGVPGSWKVTREHAVYMERGKGIWYLSRWKLGDSLEKVWLWPKIQARIWTASSGIRNMCVGAKYQCAETTHSNSRRKLLGPEATYWHPDWCRQGALCLEAERQSLCGSSSQKATAPPHGSGTEAPPWSQCAHPLQRPTWNAERRQQVLILSSSQVGSWGDSRKVSKFPLSSLIEIINSVLIFCVT